MPLVPVALFAYRRPDLLARTLASLRANGVPLLYAFSDGPREASVASDVERVRQLLRAVNWTQILLVERPRNFGVAEQELTGISQVLEEHTEMIACEEDLEFAPGSYGFLGAALERYRDEPRVMGVTAWNHARVTPANVDSQPYFSGRTSSLLWGTWRRAWRGMPDRSCAELCNLCHARGIDPKLYGNDLAESAMYETAHGQWDMRFNLHMLAQSGLFLFPARSMVAHTGFGPGATNSPHAQGWEDTISPAPPPDRIIWPRVEEHPGSAALWRRAVNAPPKPSLVTRVKRRVLRLWRRR